MIPGERGIETIIFWHLYGLICNTCLFWMYFVGMIAMIYGNKKYGSRTSVRKTSNAHEVIEKSMHYCSI